MNKFIKDSLILCLITLISGLFLGVVYELTFDARAEQQEKTKIKAYKTVYSEADNFKEIDIDDAIYREALSNQNISNKNVVIDSIVAALSKEGETIGYIINVTSKEGFAGDISFVVGIDKELKVKGVSMLSIGETPGLGMNAAEDEFLDKYKVDRNGLFIVNKESDIAGTNIDAISGATITSKAVTKGVNAAIIVADVLFEDETAKEVE